MGIRGQKTSLRRVLMTTFLLLALVPLFVAMTYSHFAYKSGIHSEILRRTNVESDRLQQSLQTWVTRAETSALSHGRNPQLVYTFLSGNESQLRLMIEGYRKNPTDFVAIYQNDGTPLVLSGFEIPLKGEKGVRVVKDGLAFFFDVPLKSPLGRSIGVYREGFLLNQKWFELNTRKLGQNGILMGPQKQLLASSLAVDRRDSFVKTLVRHHEQFSFAGENFEAGNFMAQLWPIKNSVGSLVAYLGVVEATDGAREIFQKNLFTIGFITLIAAVLIIMLALVATGKITRPIQILVNASRALKEGEVPDHIPSGSFRELNELMDAFDEMAQSVTQSKKMLEEKLMELQKANQSIRNAQAKVVHSAKMAGLGQLVAGVAHELNNPIGFIHTNMHQLEEYAQSLFRYIDVLENAAVSLEEKKKQKETLEIEYIQKDLFDLVRSCKDGAVRTKDIVQSLKTFSRLDEAQIKEVDLHETLQSTFKILKSELKHTKLKLEFAQNLPRIMCYVSQLNQVWMNLISNAAQAVPEGGGVITVRTVEDGSYVVVQVADNGAGIRPEDLDKIFEPFFTTKEVGKGTGLGLSICYNVIQKHGGTITVSSKLGQGSVFTVSLPKNLQASTG